MYSKSELLLSSNYCSDCSVIPRWWIQLIPLTFHPLPLTSQHVCPILCHGCSCSCLHTNKQTCWMPAWKVSNSLFFFFFPSPSTIWFSLCRWWMRFLHSLLSHFHFLFIFPTFEFMFTTSFITFHCALVTLLFSAAGCKLNAAELEFSMLLTWFYPSSLCFLMIYHVWRDVHTIGFDVPVSLFSCFHLYFPW